MELKPSGRIAELARELCALSGVRAWAVGGCVRDWLLGRRTKDLDIVTEGDASVLADYCRRRYGARSEAFGAFGTVRCFFPDGSRIDFARARAEEYVSPAALPRVSPAGLSKDLQRRDFAANAIAAAPLSGGRWGLTDPFNGASDIGRGVLRILHPASFRDDPTRLYRACRFAARLGWRLEHETETLMRRAVREKLPGLLSRARLRQELLRILEEEKPGAAFGLLRRYGLDDFIYPGLRWTPGAARAADAHSRLGALACALGAGGEDFVASLELERHIGAELRGAVTLCAARRSPEKSLSKLQKNIVVACFPRLPKAALRSRQVDGRLLKALGLPPGRMFAKIIGSAARAQWEGKISTAADAKAWLAKKKLAVGGGKAVL